MTDTVERKSLSREDLLDVYRTMRTIREFEERVHAEFATGDIPGFVHLYAGEEASAAGAVRYVIEGAGHMPHMERPVEVQTAIEDTIARAT
jgi:TPP-dependent pyruvate/acetoin dehydrogenase alpha subunit